MSHSSYTFDAGHGRAFSADCWASASGRNEITLRTDGSSAHLILSDAQIESLHAAVQQRVTQIIALRTNEAKVVTCVK